MAFVTYPLDDIDYSAEDAELFHCTRTSGIYAGDDFTFSVTGADNIITIGAGIGWIRNAKFKGKVIAMKEDTQIDMGLPDAAYPRIDVLVIQFSANGNATDLVIKNGAPSSNPAIPAITQTEAVYELYICAVRREVGATAITAKDITDLRLDPKYCGLMANAITKIDTNSINAQIAALISQLQEEIAKVKAGTAYVMKSGDTMTGPLNLPAPTENAHATNKQYVDGKKFSASFTIGTGWVGDSAPYTQTVAVAGILETDYPSLWLITSADKDTRIKQREALAMITDGDTADGYITFICDEDKPGVELPVYIEVSR